MRLVYFAMRFPTLSQTFIQREVLGLRGHGLTVEVYPCLPTDRASWEDALVREGVVSPGIWGWLLGLGWWGLAPGKLFDILRKVAGGRYRSGEQVWHTCLGLMTGLRVAWLLRKDPPEAVHGCWATAPATAAWVASILWGRPFGFGAHAYDIYRCGGDALLSHKLREACWVHTTTEAALRYLVEREPLAKIVLARRGLPELPTCRSVRELDGETIQILSVGRLVKKKGFSFGLEVAAALKRRGCRFVWRIVGAGGERDFLLSRTSALGLESEVIWEGAQPQAEVQALYQRADFFWHTGLIDPEGDRDGLPNVIPEAMAAGCLVMTTATDGPMEAVVHGVTGWIPGEKPEGWAEAVVELAGSVTVREEIRAAARRWVEEHFSMVKNTGLLVAAIRACEETPVRQDGGKNL